MLKCVFSCQKKNSHLNLTISSLILGVTRRKFNPALIYTNDTRFQTQIIIRLRISIKITLEMRHGGSLELVVQCRPTGHYDEHTSKNEVLWKRLVSLLIALIHPKNTSEKIYLRDFLFWADFEFVGLFRIYGNRHSRLYTRFCTCFYRCRMSNKKSKLLWKKFTIINALPSGALA